MIKRNELQGSSIRNIKPIVLRRFTMRKICTIALALSLLFGPLLSCSCDGQGDQTAFISGVVFEETTKAPLSGVSVYLNDKVYETGADARFIFADLVPGETYALTIKRDYFEPYADKFVAVYPSLDKEIPMKLASPPGAVSPVGNISVKGLSSFDFEIQFGIDRKEVAFTETGAFVSPNMYKYEMKTKERGQEGMPTDSQKKEPKDVFSYSVEIGNRQWVDFDGKGFQPTEKFHAGFRDLFSLIDGGISDVNRLLSGKPYTTDLGGLKFGSHNCKRVKGIGTFSEPIKTPDNKPATETVLMEFNLVVITDPDLKGVPVELECSSYRNVSQVRNWTLFKLANFNLTKKIDPPKIGSK